ncbi:AraC family transcriptional regulator [Phenylobacterium sp.]|uniref:helix-turn-helix domain-containing protein n=1 Tax=Phenylobacterium sp. TaxID=1871053 RepID=UPI0011FBE698|nr:AraC family transcriptional regulator [Phenylobacterium sp.]THD64825.1 MAG: AraC family transcriptional regulator [Phenylobacterium sp.]
MTLSLTPAPSDAPGEAAALALDGLVTLAELPEVWIRHQALAPFQMEYDGRRPMVIFLFNAAQPARGGPAFPRGAFSLLVPGEPRRLESAEPVETLAVAFSPREGIRLPAVSTPPPGTVDPGVHALAHEVRRVLLTEGDEARAYLERLTDTLITRAAQVAGGAPARRRPDLAPFNLRRVQEHIDSRLPERITVDELAAVAGLSRGYFSRAFHAATGESPHQFILARRLAEARQRLDAGADDLSLLAIQTGFSSHAHLTTAFGHAFGMAPQAYRRRMAGLAAPDSEPR